MKPLKLIGTAFLRIGLLALLVAPAGAQNVAEVTGTVSDGSGAVVAGAVIKVIHPATNHVRQVRTNESGNYTVPFLPPGQYDVRVELPGFKTATRKDLLLQTGDVARVNFSLDVGDVTQTVEVYAAAVPLLNTENAAVGTVIENKRIVELPLNGRNYLQLVALSPNVTQEQGAGGFTDSRQGGERGNQTISIGGQRIQFNRYTLDGVENTDVNFNSFIIRPSIDALQEFKVQTGIYPAEHGRATSHIVVTTKSGTNQYHGTVFEFLRNSALDAKEWRQQGEKNAFRRNQYGFTLGGPIRIPKILDGRDKLFFMSNFEGLKDRKYLQGTANVATQRMREGDFSAVSRIIYDPLTRVFTGTGASRRAISATAFPNNRIPRERFHPLAVKLLEFYPLPTRPGDNTVENFVRQRQRRQDWDQFTQRIDFIEGQSSSWFGRYSWGDEAQNKIADFPTQEGAITTTVYQAMLSNTRTFGTRLVNEFRFGYNQFRNDVIGHFAYKRNVGAELNINRLGSPPEAAWGTPEIGMGDGINGFGESNVGPYVNRNHSFTWVDNVSLMRGKHSLKFGGEFRRDRYNQFGNDIIRGVFSFSNIPTFDPAQRTTTGFAFASYLLGTLTQSQRSLGLPSVQLRASSYSLFIDDSWKVTSKLTLNLGLRYENTPPYYDKQRGLVNAQMFDPGVGPNGILPNTRVPILTRVGSGDFYEGALIHFADIVPIQSDGENVLGGRGLVKPDNNDFAPRIGLAYSPTPGWTFRAGVGIFYAQDIGQARFDMSRNLAGRAFFRANDEVPDSDLSDPWAADTTEAGCSNWAGECAGASTQVMVLNVARRTPYISQWMGNVQRQLTQSMALEVGYLGNSGAKLERIRSYNEPVARTSRTDSRALQARRPWPMLGRVHMLDSIVNSNYHAASVKLQQHFTKGLTYLMGFTWAKAMDNGSAIRNQAGDILLAANGYDFNSERALSQYHIGRRFVSSWLYQLPFGAGQRFLNHRGAVNKIIGGWQVGSIVTLSDGTPQTPTIPETNGTDWGDRPHATGVSPIPSNRTADNFWNIAAFDGTHPDLFFQFGSAGRHSLIGPGTRQWDFSVVKDTLIAEGHSLQFRFEAFNFPNHPNWNAPPTNVRVPTTFGRVTTARTMREMQFSLKYIF